MGHVPKKRRSRIAYNERGEASAMETTSDFCDSRPHRRFMKHTGCQRFTRHLDNEQRRFRSQSDADAGDPIDCRRGGNVGVRENQFPTIRPAADKLPRETGILRIQFGKPSRVADTCQRVAGCVLHFQSAPLIPRSITRSNSNSASFESRPLCLSSLTHSIAEETAMLARKRSNAANAARLSRSMPAARIHDSNRMLMLCSDESSDLTASMKVMPTIDSAQKVVPLDRRDARHRTALRVVIPPGPRARPCDAARYSSFGDSSNEVNSLPGSKNCVAQDCPRLAKK